MFIDEFNTLFAWEAYDLKEWIIYRQTHSEPVITPLTWVKIIYGNSFDCHQQRFGWFELINPDIDAGDAFRQMGQQIAVANNHLPILMLFLAGAASPAICQVNRYTVPRGEDSILPVRKGPPVVCTGQNQLYLAAYAPSTLADSGEYWAMAVYNLARQGKGIANEYICEHTEWFAARSNIHSLYARSLINGYTESMREAIPA